MYTIIETPVFQRYASDIWQDDEREAFISWIAGNPLAGDVAKLDELPADFLNQLREVIHNG